MKEAESSKETLRITIIIGILAIFLTLLIYLTPRLSKELTIQNIMTFCIYGYFVLICYYFVFYILHKADSLTYKESTKGTWSEDYNILLNYVMLWVLRRKAIPKDKKERYKLLISHKRDYTYYYDAGVGLAMLFPFIFGMIVFSNLVVNHIMTILSVNIKSAYIIAATSYLVVFFIIALTFNFLRYKITGTQ